MSGNTSWRMKCECGHIFSFDKFLGIELEAHHKAHDYEPFTLKYGGK